MHVSAPADRPALVVVGLGINAFGQLTVESIARMKDAEVLLYLGVEPVGEAVARQLNPGGFESLLRFYAPGKDRKTTYDEITEAILTPVRAGKRVCVAVYGHPGIYVNPTHRAIRSVRDEGRTALMLPAVSALDCLAADLGLDPGLDGLTGFDASDFLFRRRRADPAVPLVLWQIGVVGIRTTPPAGGGPSPFLILLTDRLLETYPPDHEVILYEAPALPNVNPTIHRLPLAELWRSAFATLSTLYVPPLHPAEADPRLLSLLPGPNAS